ncbi:phosphoglycerate mutase-like protein [Aspergillus heteromorphus CBS 117.55]|uniref:Phosphoglycerate mutase-like protein n=1 Tax=Aspergillus heteromorphus CBS 117.55 TaxID=1448321 RepID=A0A317VZF7_9EURO|nr:phosphoglycerate mutase-like protein [Aspergillus heteromorphus CBS 117.55]PWY79165.1 phosphoglycerate mutase-like protein [Aspergillus heteromorphus CBS 117.55]
MQVIHPLPPPPILPTHHHHEALLPAAPAPLHNSQRHLPLQPPAPLRRHRPILHPKRPPIDPHPPPSCTVTRAAYLVRHAAIYANDFDYETYIAPLVEKLRNTTQPWPTTGPLSFLSNWTAPVDDAHLEKLTRVGLQEATTLGSSFRQRYPDLRAQKVWSSTADRTVKSAQGFIAGWTNTTTTNNVSHADVDVDLVQVAESASLGADSLTPYKACPAYSSSYGSDFENTFVKTYTRPILTRLNTHHPSFNFTATDITAMFELCGYETVIRGHLPSAPCLCSPRPNGSPSNTRTTSYGGGDGRQDLFVSFTHRELPPTVVTALGLFNNTAYTSPSFLNQSMPTDEVNYYRAWRSSHILPFLGNVGIERLECDGDGQGEGVYFRVLVNGAVQPVIGCRDGPGGSCSAGGFGEWMRGREEEFGDFGAACGNASASGELGIYA